MKIGGTSRPWTAEDIATAARIFAERRALQATRAQACIAIAKVIGRSFDGICYRLSNYGPTFQRNCEHIVHSKKIFGGVVAGVCGPSIPDAVIRERDHRLALDYPDLTSAFCGDPKPGYSALDRKKQVVTLEQRPQISAVNP